MSNIDRCPGLLPATTLAKEAKMTIKGILAVVMAVAFVGTVGLVVMATGGEQEGAGSGTQDGHGESNGFMHHLHQLGMKIHGGSGHSHPSPTGSHMAQVAQLIHELDLTDAQQARFERIHEILGARDHEDPAGMIELHEKLMAQFEAGQVETGELHDAIDAHLEQIRKMAYGVTDEMIGLINDLDEEQREQLQTRLAEFHDNDG